MSCVKCGTTTTDCGCTQEALSISQICNPVICDTEECSETFKAGCIIFTDDDIVCNNTVIVTAGDTVAQAIANLTAYICSLSGIENDISCNGTTLVASGDTIDVALTNIISYFCSNMIIGHNLFSTDSTDINGCVVRTWTINLMAGSGIVDSIVFNSPPICPQEKICDSTSVGSPSLTDQIIACRTSLGQLTPVKFTYQSLLTNIVSIVTSQTGNVLSSWGDDFGFGSGPDPSVVSNFSQAIAGNSLQDGDELECFVHLEYKNNDPMTIRFEIGPSDFLDYTMVNAIDDIRFINVKMAILTSTSQMWTLSATKKDATEVVVDEMLVDFTTNDTSLNTNFKVSLINAGASVNSLIIKKIILYKNKLI